MNDLIERYVYNVTKRLPEASRGEVAKELHANISDMLPENPKPEDIRKVLIELGEPRELAGGYREHQRYLISPKWMDEYLQVLKIVMIVFGSITLVFGLIDHIMNPEATTLIGIIGEVFGQVISEVIGSLFRAFTIVTLIFAAIDIYGTKYKKAPWNPDNLPKLPKMNVKKISRVESVIGLMCAAIFGSIFVYLLYYNQLYIGWYDGAGPHFDVIPLFSDAIVQTFVPLYIGALALTITSCLVKWKYAHWNVSVAIIHTIDKIFGLVIFLAFVQQPNLLNAEFLARASTFFEVAANDIATGVTEGATGFAIFLCFISLIDIIAAWVKALKPQSETIKRSKR